MKSEQDEDTLTEVFRQSEKTTSYFCFCFPSSFFKRWI